MSNAASASSDVASFDFPDMARIVARCALCWPARDGYESPNGSRYAVEDHTCDAHGVVGTCLTMARKASGRGPGIIAPVKTGISARDER